MPKPGLSATDIGDKIGLPPVETNMLLKAQGFLSGDKGNYLLTEKGKEFGVHVDHDNGYGGSAHRQWYATYYDESILGELDTSPDALEQVRANATADRAEKAAALKAERARMAAEWEETHGSETDEPADLDWQKILVGLGILGGAALAGYGIYRGVQRLRRRRAEKATSDEDE